MESIITITNNSNILIHCTHFMPALHAITHNYDNMNINDINITEFAILVSF